MRSILTMALAGALSMSSFAFASETEKWAPETFELDNGMEVIVLPDHRAPVVTHMVWYRVGAADEDEGKSGIAHLFEHLMFKATDDIEAGEFSKTVARNGGQDNAFTSWDYTAYFQRIAKDRLETMMRMEADRMTDLILTEEEVYPERDVVREERRQRIDNRPGALLFEKTMAALYPDHPYGIPVIGFMDEVEALDINDANSFYEEWYAPENAILVVAGDITAAELKPLALEIYGPIERQNPEPKPRNWPAVTPLTENVTVTHTDPKVRQPSWSQYWQSTSYTTPGSGLEPHALDLAAEILGGGRTSRLYQALVEEQKIAVSAYAWTMSTLRAEGPFVIGGSPANGATLKDVASAANAVLAEFIAFGPTDEELARAKSNLVAGAIFARDSQSSMAQLYGSTRAIGGDIDRISSWPDEIKSVTPDDIVAALKKYIEETSSVTAKLLLPEAE